MYEILIFIFISIVFECGGGILYGIAIGLNPVLTLVSVLTINILMIIAAVRLVNWALNWRKGIRDWIQRRVARGKKLIDKYGWVGILIGAYTLSPVQMAIISRLLGMKSRTLYLGTFGSTIVVSLTFLGIALGMFSLIFPR